MGWTVFFFVRLNIFIKLIALINVFKQHKQNEIWSKVILYPFVSYLILLSNSNESRKWKTIKSS